MRIESQAFHALDVVVVIPSTVVFVAFDAVPNGCGISIADGYSCPEFDHWRQLREFGITVDFRRIFRVSPGLGNLKDYEINVRMFEEGLVLRGFDRILSQRYLRRDDDLELVVKLMPRWKSMEKCEIEIDNLLNLRHPCIVAPIGIVFPGELSECRELKIVRLYVEGNSLVEVISKNPVWWTATAKAKAVAGIVLGIRFAHSHGLIHGHLNSSNIFFDSNHRIQIMDFCVMGQEIEGSEKDINVGVRSFSGAGWSPKIDIDGFASILMEILVGHPAIYSSVSNFQAIFPTDLPIFVSEMISTNQSPDRRISESFNDIFDILKENYFQILSGVDFSEVLTFVTWIELFE
jgi:serine/threonine protein kinase